MIATNLPDESATEAFAHALGDALRAGDLILLTGEIGAGKTTLVRYLAARIGCVEPVRSPTYTIAHLYSLGGDRTLAHLDLYRNVSMGEAQWGDLEPYFDATVAVVEWPAAAEPWLAGRATIRIELRVLDEQSRVALVSVSDPQRARALADDVIGLVRLQS